MQYAQGNSQAEVRETSVDTINSKLEDYINQVRNTTRLTNRIVGGLVGANPSSPEMKDPFGGSTQSIASSTTMSWLGELDVAICELRDTLNRLT